MAYVRFINVDIEMDIDDIKDQLTSMSWGDFFDSVEDLKEWVEDCSPEELFDEEILKAWALENGFVEDD